MPAAEKSHAQYVLSTLNQQRALGRFCDAVLNVGEGMVYLAHCNILACFSELFQESNMPAAPCMEFCLQECPSDGLELLLNFVYTGELKLDDHNLERVQHAATSLCVPEALALCRQFKETSEDPACLKRKRGRPRKSTLSPPFSVKEESASTVAKDVSSTDAATARVSTAAAGTATTTTRSGRVVKGPRRLVTDENPSSELTTPEKHSKRPPFTPSEGGGGEAVVENLIPDQPTRKTEVKANIQTV